MTAAGPAEDSQDRFGAIAAIVADPLHFKARLGIGERAYASLRLRDAVFEAWDVAGVAATGATVAKSSLIAGAFFGGTGIWAWLGLGGAAVTPIGWVIAAAVGSGAAWFGISRYLKSMGSGRVTVIPHFIQTPLDVLALNLFEMMAPLMLKLAAADGAVSPAERDRITRHLTRDWGYDPAFVGEGLAFAETRLPGISTGRLAGALAAFQRANPDCDFDAMTAGLLAELRAIAAIDAGPDGPDPRKARLLSRVEAVFRARGRGWTGRRIAALRQSAGRLGRRLRPAKRGA